MTIDQSIMLSSIVDKINPTINAEASQEQAGYEMVKQLITKAHLASDEIKTFVADYQDCSVEEAGKIDIKDFIKKFIEQEKLAEVKTFFTSAVKKELQK